MKNEIIETLLNALSEKYGDVNDDSGCYVRTDYGHEWLSVKAVKDFIIDTINEYYWD